MAKTPAIAPDAETAPARFNAGRLLPWVLVAVGVLVYLNTLPNEFVFDDTPHVERARVEGWGDFVEKITSTGRPVVDLTLMVNRAAADGLEAWGLAEEADQPIGFHLVNIVIHVLAGVTLFGIVRRLLDLPDWTDRVRGRGPWLAFAIALIWVVHPLNTQAVSYMIQRHESLMGLFFLLTVYATIRCATAKRATSATRLWAAAAIATCFLGMGTKQVMAGAPIVALLVDRCFIAGSFGEALRRRWGLYLGLAATWLWLAWLSASGLIAEHSSAGLKMQALTPVQYFLSQGEVIAWYIRLAFWPSPLVLDYQVAWLPAAMRAEVEGPIAWLPGVVAIGLLVVIGAIGVGFNRWWGVCAAWFFLVLGVTSSFIPIADIAFEHRMYLPLIAIVALVVIGFDALLVRIASRLVAVGIEVVWVVVVALTLATLTIDRNFEYATKISIWDTVVLRVPNNPRGWHNLGTALSDANRGEEAMFAFERVLERSPNYAAAYNGIGNLYLDLHGRPDLAIPRYARAVELEPDDAEYHYNLGRAYLFTNQLDTAREHLARAVELKDGDYARAQSNLGVALAKSGNTPEAILAFRSAIAQDPSMLDAYQNLASALAAEGRFDEAAGVVEQMLTVARAANLQPDALRNIEAKLDELRLQTRR